MFAEFSNPAGLFPTFGWTHVVATTGGKLIHISGQVGINAKGEVIGPGDLKRQTEQAFENIKTALAAASATVENVVKSTLVVVNSHPAMVPTIRELSTRYFSTEHPPASTLVGVTALASPDWLIEIEATAVIAE